MESMTCPECGKPMTRRPSKFKPNMFWWGCTGYPECRVVCAEHPDGSLMSTPVNEEVKKKRIYAHHLAGQIWGKWDTPQCNKKAMYEWMKINTKSGHIGKMDDEEVSDLIAKLEWLLKK